MLDPDVRARALELGRRPVHIQCKDREVKVWWRGAEKDPSVLGSACRLVAALTRASARS